ncbi:MAG TPA: DUF1385 domain-containing protein [Armatimonadota bacterium]
MSEPVSYGGQAVIEGVMMRGPRYFAVVCRRADGQILEHKEPVEASLGRFAWLKRPFLRGTFALLDALMLGVKALHFSANVALADAEGKAGVSEGPKSVRDAAVTGSMVLGLGVGVALFMWAPSLGAGLLHKTLHGDSRWLNAAEGVLRLALFLGYLLVISQLKDIRRVFEYHGAEHKTINAYEAGLALTVPNVRSQSRIHPRCGTSFIIIVLVIATLVHALMGWSVWYWRILQRLLVLPLVAGIAFEVIRLAGKHKDSLLLKWILSPGLATQRLTTREPSDDQMEVAIRALEGVLEKEQQLVQATG